MNIMRKLSLLCAFPVLAVMLGGCAGNDLTAMTAAKEMGIGINLGNTFEAFWQDENNLTTGAQTIGENTPQNYETCWGAVVTTEECIHGMKEAGFNTVRIPVYWGNMMADDGEYTINEEYISRVQEVVDWCLKENMYAIINIHHYDEFLIKHHDKEEVLKAAAHVWEQVAEHFKNYSDSLIFEGFNEALGTPPNEGDWAERSDDAYSYVNDMNQVFVDTVRKSGGKNAKRVLIVSG